jgi:hypothetical protein
MVTRWRELGFMGDGGYGIPQSVAAALQVAWSMRADRVFGTHKPASSIFRGPLVWLFPPSFVLHTKPSSGRMRPQVRAHKRPGNQRSDGVRQVSGSHPLDRTWIEGLECQRCNSRMEISSRSGRVPTGYQRALLALR